MGKGKKRKVIEKGTGGPLGGEKSRKGKGEIIHFQTNEEKKKRIKKKSQTGSRQ